MHLSGRYFMRNEPRLVHLHLASRFRGTIYTGVTSDPMRRIWEHRNGIRYRFPSRCSIYRFVWWEAFGDIEFAIRREKPIKRWHRQWKVNLIEATNPHCTLRRARFMGRGGQALSGVQQSGARSVLASAK